MHVRQQIREQAITFIGATATFSQRVSKTRPSNLGSDEPPWATVSAPEETVETTPSRKERTLTLVVEITAASESTEDSLDDLCVVVENALDDITLNGLAVDVRLESTEISTTRQQQVQAGSARLVFSVLYHTSLTDPETAI